MLAARPRHHWRPQSSVKVCIYLNLGAPCSSSNCSKSELQISCGRGVEECETINVNELWVQCREGINISKKMLFQVGGCGYIRYHLERETIAKSSVIKCTNPGLQILWPNDLLLKTWWNTFNLKTKSIWRFELLIVEQDCNRSVKVREICFLNPSTVRLFYSTSLSRQGSLYNSTWSPGQLSLLQKLAVSVLGITVVSLSPHKAPVYMTSFWSAVKRDSAISLMAINQMTHACLWMCPHAWGHMAAKRAGLVTLYMTFSERELIPSHNRLRDRYGKLLHRYLGCLGDHQSTGPVEMPWY